MIKERNIIDDEEAMHCRADNPNSAVDGQGLRRTGPTTKSDTRVRGTRMPIRSNNGPRSWQRLYSDG